MARKTSKIETVTKAAGTNVETTALVPAAKPPRKATPKKSEPERALDWTPLGKAVEWRASRIRMAQAINAKASRRVDQTRLEWLYYTASAFFAGLTFGVLIASWLR